MNLTLLIVLEILSLFEENSQSRQIIYLRRKIAMLHCIIVERTAGSLRRVHQLKQIIASGLSALPHAALQHFIAARCNFA